MRQHAFSVFHRGFELGCVLLLSVVACGGSSEEATSYHSRGLVQDISGKGPDLRVTIHHEAIPTFKDRDGKDSPMSSMSMIFGLGDSISPKSIAVGDKIEIDFDVRFSMTPPLLIKSVKKLPADAALTLTGE